MKSSKLRLLLLVGWLAACGAERAGDAPPMSPVPGQTTQFERENALDRAEPRTLEEAEAALEHARAELYQLALVEVPAASSGAPPAPASAPAPARNDAAPREERAQEEGAETEAERSEAERSASDPCATACRAFGSLLRAKDAVCRLEEPRGDRCARAEDVVRDAVARVRSCACNP